MTKDDKRPSPDALLAHVEAEERKANRGKLKIYLGAAPGVGKTYSMLQDALAKRSQGLDVVIGVVESHGRKEIDNFINKFEVLPRKTINYRNKTITEFDLDEALKRNPALILIDEMAHTNAPTSRHNKRWQDIKEILDRGIDVYTALNIQHIESLNDVVTQIIHTRVKETVPDFMFDKADAVELVDLPTEDLLKRLAEGKVYIPKQAALAVEHFFRSGNLNALRELALRATAERVGDEVLSYRQGKGIKYIWPTKEKLLVCVGKDAQSNKIIRASRRMAVSLQADWLAVHVDNGNYSTEEKTQAIQNLRLAEQLGAETRILAGIDITQEIINCARDNNVTKIVIGKHMGSMWKNFFSLTDKIVRASEEIDVYLITYDKKFKPIKNKKIQGRFPWEIYLLSILVVTLTTLVGIPLLPFTHNSASIIMLYLGAIILVSLFGRIGPSILASFLSIIAYGYFFIPPYHTFLLNEPEHLFILIVMLVIASIVSHLTILTRKQAHAARLAEQRTGTLHSLSRQLAGTRGVKKLIDTATTYLAEVFNSEVIALLFENNKLTIQASVGGKFELNEKEQSVALWVYDLGQVAGMGTDTLPFSDALYIPMLSSLKSIGVLRVKPRIGHHLFTPEQMHLLEACANQIALAIEVDKLHEQTKESELQSETDRVRGALLEAVSHDLRTPLVAVMGAATTLMEMVNELDARTIKKLATSIYFELEQLNRLLNNLLQISYLETKAVTLAKEPYFLKDIIEQTINTTTINHAKERIILEIPDTLPAVPLDKALIQEVFFNLLENAIKFTPIDTPIEIVAEKVSDKVMVSVLDHGPGIAPDEVDKLFEKFYRGRLLTTVRGLGLGLAICRNIIKAHGGEMWAENRKDGEGASFRFFLPLH